MFNMFNQQKNLNAINEEIGKTTTNGWTLTKQYSTVLVKSCAEGAVYGLAVVGAVALAYNAYKNNETNDEN